MRKILTKIVTLFLITVLSVTAFAGCALITIDTDKDMAQVVATVQIEDDITADHIHKIEMLSAFMSYGYMYVQQYGYTVEATYEMILKNLVQNKIIIQGARMALADKYNEKVGSDDFLAYFIDNATATENLDASAASMGEDYTVEELLRVVEELEKYLTPYEIAQAKHSIRTSINQLVETYAEDDEEDDGKEDETFEARAVPTQKENEAEYEYQLLKTEKGDPDLYEYTDYDLEVAIATLKGVEGAKEGLEACEDVWHLNKYVFDNYKIDLSGSNLKSFNVAIKDLKKNGLIAQDENPGVTADNADKAMNYSYFLISLKSQYESMIVSKYENSLVTKYKGELSQDKIWAQYQAELKAQKENYENNVNTYESALDAVTEETFVLCNPYEGYGYVANLLIGFSDEQAAALSAEKSKAGATAATIEAKRAQLLGQLKVKDQRESWVYSSYGEYKNGEFSFDKKNFLSENSYDKLGKFIGKVFVYDEEGSVGENEDGVEETNWRFSNVIPEAKPFSYLVDLFNELFEVKDTENALKAENNSTGKVDLTDDKRDILDDLIYAFSTDPGSLGSYLGYTYSPFTSATTYVAEFAEAAKNVVAGGVGSYELVATDFGYHLIVCTGKVTQGENEYSDDEAGKDLFLLHAYGKDDVKANEESLAYKYKELKLDSFVSTEISKVADKLINEKYEEEGVVTYNKKAYKDLIPETEESEDEHAGHNH